MSLHDAALEGSTSFLQGSSTSRTPLESSRLAELKYAFPAGQDIRLKMMALEPLSIDDLKAWASRGINNFISIQLYKPYAVGKLSIS